MIGKLLISILKTNLLTRSSKNLMPIIVFIMIKGNEVNCSNYSSKSNKKLFKI